MTGIRDQQKQILGPQFGWQRSPFSEEYAVRTESNEQGLAVGVVTSGEANLPATAFARRPQQVKGEAEVRDGRV
jgi:hypothetical protein